MRSKLVVSVVALVMVGLIGAGLRSTVFAQDMETEGHPLVGTWIADTDPENTSNAFDMFTFNADGSYIEADANGDLSLGAWVATGPNTATLTTLAFQGDDEGNNYGGFMVRASIEVAEDGASFTATYTLELLSPDGTTSGQAGPGTATGTRLEVEAPGTPSITFDELFSSFGGDEEATPEP